MKMCVLISYLLRNFILVVSLSFSGFAAADNDYEAQQFLDINGQRLHYITRGQQGKSLLLFIHGAPERAEVWLNYMERFSDEYFTVAFTTRGYYPSSIPAEVDAYDTSILAADAHAVANALGYTRYSVVGHDWGASVAWRLAFTYPDAVQKVVAMANPHPITYARAYHLVPEHKQAVNSYIPDIVAGNEPWNRESTLEADLFHFRNIVFTEQAGFSYSPLLREQLWQTWSMHNGASIDAVYNHYKALDFPFANFPPCSTPGFQFLTVQQPALVFYGGQDPYVAPEAYEFDDSCTPNAKLVKFERGDHWVHRNYQGAIIDIMMDFLSHSIEK